MAGGCPRALPVPSAPATGSDTPSRATHTAAPAPARSPQHSEFQCRPGGLLKRHAKDSCRPDAVGLLLFAETLGASSPDRPCCWLIKG